MLLLISLMFEKVTKWFTSKATDTAIEGAKTSLNEKIDQYGDIIKVGLVLSIIIFGGRHITRRGRNDGYIAQGSELVRPQGGQPIIINNYYPEYRCERNERRQRS